MNLRQHETRDDMKVWLSESEVDDLLDHAENQQQRIAFELEASRDLQGSNPLCHVILTRRRATRRSLVRVSSGEVGQCGFEPQTSTLSEWRST